MTKRDHSQHDRAQRDRAHLAALASQPAARKGPIQLVAWEPSTERAVVLIRVVLWTLGSTFAAAMGITLAAVAAPALRLGLLALAFLVGLTPLVWHKVRTRRAHRLPTWDLTPKLARNVAEAAEQAERLRRMANRSPNGAVADHLAHLADTAEGYVVTLHSAATQASLAGRDDAELERDMARVVAQLSDLAESAQGLREAQKQHLEVSPLEELTAQTERLTAAIEAGDSLLAPAPEPDHGS
jgi:hypothetical protein